MAFDLTGARARLNIAAGDTSKDSQINMALDAALAIVENYLDRLLLQKQEAVEVIHQHGDTIQLHRFPIKNIVSVTPSRKHQVHNAAGLIVFDKQHLDRNLKVVYVGGFSRLPADLELALWMVFDDMYALQTGGSGGGGMAAGEISSISIPDVGTIRYATGGTTAAGGAGGGDISDVIPDSALALLEPYRLKAA